MKIHIPLPIGTAAANRLARTAISIINTADPNLTPAFNNDLDVEEYIKFFKWTDDEQISTSLKITRDDDMITVEVLGHHIEKILSVILNNVAAGILPAKTYCNDLKEYNV